MTYFWINVNENSSAILKVLSEIVVKLCDRLVIGSWKMNMFTKYFQNPSLLVFIHIVA